MASLGLSMGNSREALDGANSDGYVVVRKRKVSEAAAAPIATSSGADSSSMPCHSTSNWPAPVAGMLMWCDKCFSKPPAGLRMSCLLHSVGHAGLIHDSSASVAYSDPAKPLKISDIPFPRPNTHLEELTAIVTMLIFFG